MLTILLIAAATAATGTCAHLGFINLRLRRINRELKRRCVQAGQVNEVLRARNRFLNAKLAELLICAAFLSSCGQERKEVTVCGVFEVMQRAESGAYVSAGYFDSVDVKSRTEALCWVDGKNLRITSRNVVVYYLPCDPITTTP